MFTCSARIAIPSATGSSTPPGTGTRASCACACCASPSPPARERGRCTVYRPDIGDLLPVYVADRYEAIEARTFAECSDEEIARYVAANVVAVREVVERAGSELALANHLVMGPAILARAAAAVACRTP